MRNHREKSAVEGCRTGRSFRLESGIMPGQVLQRTACGGGSAHLRGTAPSHADGIIFLEVRTGETRRQQSPESRIGRCYRGTWTAHIRNLPCGGPYVVILRLEDSRIRIPDIFVGDVWVLAGQSNMAGEALTAAAPRVRHAVRSYTSWGEWTTAREPLHFPPLCPDSASDADVEKNIPDLRQAHRAAQKGMGPGLSFGRSMFGNTGVPQGLIPCAVGGSGLDLWDPDAQEAENSLYARMMRRIAECRQPVAGILWHQGCAEMRRPQEYTSRMKRLVASVRSDLKQPHLPWLMAQLGKSHLFDEAESGRDALISIREQQRRLPESVKHCSVVPTIDLGMQDFIHLDTNAQRALGRRLARAALHHQSDRHQTDAIVLRRIRLIPWPANWRQETAVEITFENVREGLCADGVPAGFCIITPEGRLLRRIYRTICDGSRVLLLAYTYPNVTMRGLRIAYGYEMDAYCNIHDADGMALPAFAPQRIEPLTSGRCRGRRA